jgi:phage terminase large subunit-like protein
MPFDGSFACPDWMDRLQAGKTPIADLPVDPKIAQAALNAFNDLRLPDVKGMPSLADAAGDWFRDMMVAAFAARDPETAMPLINEVFCLVPKKNSKTTYSAALGLTALMLWDTPNLDLLIIGPTQNVAERCFNQAKGMIEASSLLSRLFKVQDHKKTITRRKTGSKLSVKTFDLSVVTGEIPALTIIDELHVMASKSYADRVIAQITGGIVTNPAALIVYITTQSDTRPKGVFKTKLDFARRVRDGIVTDAQGFLPVLYEFPEDWQTDPDQPWRDVKNWALVTPNLGLSVNLDILQRNYGKAVEEGPAALIIWASQHLNIQVGMGLHDDRWAGSDYWQAAADPNVSLDWILQHCEVCTIGIDPGGLDDLLSMSVIGRLPRSRVWVHWSKSWADYKVLDLRKSIVADLADFEKANDLVMVHDLESEAYAELVEICEQVRAAGLLPEENGIGIDSIGKAAGLVIDALVDAEFEAGKDLRSVAQGYRLNNVTSLVAIKLKGGTMRHAGQGKMAWAVGNTKIEVTKNAEYPTKAASGVAKIDPLMSLFDAAELMSLHPVAANKNASYLDDAELMVL